MRLVTWNIQWARGIDGRVDPQRIVDDAKRLGDFDVLCLQEVAAGYDTLAGSAGEDQFEVFANLLPGFTAVCATPVDVAAPSGRRRFGNLLLSRLPVQRVIRHQMPWPPDDAVISMPRALLEATLDTPLGPLVVMTTHLEYHSALQRQAQIEAIRGCHAESCRRALSAGARAGAGSPYHSPPSSTRALLVGDFNFPPEDPLHAGLQQPFDELRIPRFVDVWQHLHGAQPHAPTAGVHENKYWPQPCTTDFVFASTDLLPHVRSLVVDGATQASDHQPQCIHLA
jgi:endonuclease/exonuclease/phosphatase family metal-dependent hydrolase